MNVFSFFKKVDSKNKSKSELIAEFLDLPEHKWLLDDKFIHANFYDFLTTLPKNLLQKLIKVNGVRYFPSTGKYGCAINSSGFNVVLVFPEIINLLKSTAKSNFKGILAHELGHIILGHGHRSLTQLEAQVEADRFACELGFLDDIEEFLMDCPESIEKRVRLSYLTSYIYN